MKMNNGPAGFLLRQTVSNLQNLPPEAVGQVSDFVEFLQTKCLPILTVGSPESLLAGWGKWQFTPAERTELDADIRATRERGNDRLFA